MPVLSRTTISLTVGPTLQSHMAVGENWSFLRKKSRFAPPSISP
ncbi:hypothetical protein COMA2_10261 [Candidatus Nitrospira nitrificans]|uniref:Uncharacterized protein n=1 Tax=Candidatus Nitrospira nitrificans TaxID=1742973 RepID=A0A0S4L4W5_9BACT|nr:hypothetical protein COMA2_10261 [Candidatus Nitrospira nitrificans]